MRGGGKWGAAIAGALAIGAMTAGQARAAASCWTTEEAAAAKVRDLQTMLMVAALRCHGSGTDVLADYNRFVAANRPVLVSANSLLKAHFVRIQGGAGQRGYDSFTTSLANSYGAAGSGTETCADMAGLAQEGAQPGVVLLALAEGRGLDPAARDERCPATLAAK